MDRVWPPPGSQRWDSDLARQRRLPQLGLRYSWVWCPTHVGCEGCRGRTGEAARFDFDTTIHGAPLCGGVVRDEPTGGAVPQPNLVGVGPVAHEEFASAQCPTQRDT